MARFRVGRKVGTEMCPKWRISVVEEGRTLKRAISGTFRWWKEAVHRKRTWNGAFSVLGVVEVTAKHQKHVHMDVWLVFEGGETRKTQKMCPNGRVLRVSPSKHRKHTLLGCVFDVLMGGVTEGRRWTWKMCPIGHVFHVWTKVAIRTRKTRPIWACLSCSEKGDGDGGC